MTRTSLLDTSRQLSICRKEPIHKGDPCTRHEITTRCRCWTHIRRLAPTHSIFGTIQTASSTYLLKPLRNSKWLELGTSTQRFAVTENLSCELPHMWHLVVMGQGASSDVNIGSGDGCDSFLFLHAIACRWWLLHPLLYIHPYKLRNTT